MKKIKTIPKDCIAIDILSESSFAKEHIKGAHNFCIYEVDFLDKFKKAFPDKERSFCIYGWSDKTREAPRAQWALTKAGYKNIYILSGGLEKWKNSNKSLSSKKKSSMIDGRFELRPRKSSVEWSGRNIGSKHTGTVQVEKGFLTFAKNDLKKGEVFVNMKNIKNTNLKDPYKKMIEKHLKSEDFFFAENYPVAKLEIKKATKIKNIDSKPNYQITALLTIKNNSRKIEFPAFVYGKDKEVKVNAHFDIDRTLWKVAYGSEVFFSRLGIHIIDDMVSIDIILVGEKK
jgi:polyisoprenoid-binding protein YceI